MSEVKPRDVKSALNLNPFNARERQKFDNDALREAIQRDPEAAKRKYSYPGVEEAYYPIFMAVTLGASMDVIQLFHEAYPEAHRQVDSTGWTIVHGAFWWSPSVEIIKMFVGLYPEALGMECRGKTPMMVAAEKETSSEILAFSKELEIIGNEGTSHSDLLKLLEAFDRSNWPAGFALVLDSRPHVVHATQPQGKAIYHLLEKVGKRCKLETMLEIVRGMPEIVGKT